jgi:hypothetical protein
VQLVGPPPFQLTFVCLEEVASQQEIQNSVAQKLKALIVIQVCPLNRSIFQKRFVSQSFNQKKLLIKRVAEYLFDILHLTSQVNLL